MNWAQQCIAPALAHVHALPGDIGSRGSCTSAAGQAATCAAVQMRRMGLQGVTLDPFHASPSTYRPYALAVVAALLAVLLAWFLAGAGPWPHLHSLALPAPDTRTCPDGGRCRERRTVSGTPGRCRTGASGVRVQDGRTCGCSDRCRPAAAWRRGPWHQVSDRPEHVERQSLADAFAWEILRPLDGTA